MKSGSSNAAGGTSSPNVSGDAYVSDFSSSIMKLSAKEWSSLKTTWRCEFKDVNLESKFTEYQAMQLITARCSERLCLIVIVYMSLQIAALFNISGINISCFENPVVFLHPLIFRPGDYCVLVWSPHGLMSYLTDSIQCIYTRLYTT